MDLKKLLVGSIVAGFYTTTAFAAQNYSDILNKLIPPTISYKVKVEKNSQLKGFDQLNVSIIQKKTGTVYHRYLWVSKDKTKIIPVLLENKNGKIVRVKPQQNVERIPVDISWLNNLIEKLPEWAKKSIGEGREVYLFSDPLCPFCKRELPKLLKLAENKKIKLHVLPFDVHGPQAKKGSAVFLDIEKKKGLKEALNKVELANFGDVEKMANTKEAAELLKKYSKVLDEIQNAAAKAGINGTPAMLIKTSKDKGYLILGLTDITPYIK
ncbi:DsbA family protein [Hippea jasoniae]|uniref:DsbA family protein n=1 Tax=Hippea jasoniae TaxID=944479 RepID=UPI000553464E|nr:DsbA family protein [Hippea jasoniae]